MTLGSLLYVLAIILFGIVLIMLGPPGWVIGLLVIGGFLLMIWGGKRMIKEDKEESERKK
jgi:threonine/homoserine/homoserine lactone efflux protein